MPLLGSVILSVLIDAINLEGIGVVVNRRIVCMLSYM